MGPRSYPNLWSEHIGQKARLQRRAGAARLVNFTSCAQPPMMFFRLDGQHFVSPTHHSCCDKQPPNTEVNMHHFVLASSCALQKFLLHIPCKKSLWGKVFIGIPPEVTFRTHVNVLHENGRGAFFHDSLFWSVKFSNRLVLLTIIPHKIPASDLHFSFFSSNFSSAPI